MASDLAFDPLFAATLGLLNTVRLKTLLLVDFLLVVLLAGFFPAAAWSLEPGFRSLFNGRDLAGWDGVTSDAAKSWRVDDGTIVCTGEKGTWLRSRERYGDFNFRFEYKLKPGGNSGIYVRVPADGAHREGGGVEVQLLDDAAERYKDIKPAQACGSIYLVAPATQRVGRAAGEWNSLEINCRGTSYRVIHNSVVIVDADASKFPELAKRFSEGYLGLQNHSEEVWFRNLRIGPPQPECVERAVAASCATGHARRGWFCRRARGRR